MTDTTPNQPSAVPSVSNTEARQQSYEHVFETLSLELLKESRRKRRWGVFFKLLIATYFFALLALMFVDHSSVDVPLVSKPHTAVIDIKGLIAEGADTNATDTIRALEKAFDSVHVQGIILRINSPGGSPVHAGRIYDEIQRQKKLHPNVKVYSVAGDLCASAAYYIAAATDEIYADKASIVGSIGVLLNSFGLVDTIEKLGVERRLYTAGEHKGLLDPFSPVGDTEKSTVMNMLNRIHQQFITSVKNGRGKRLSKDDSIFSGLIWTGEQAKELGLIDGLADTNFIAREIIGETRIINYTIQPDFFQKFSKSVGSQIALRLQKPFDLQFQ